MFQWLGVTVGLAHRLHAPRVDGQETDWDTALQRVADRFRDTIAAHGPDSVAFYVSGQLLTEDCDVANKLMKGFIGSANIDTNSRLCMASTEGTVTTSDRTISRQRAVLPPPGQARPDWAILAGVGRRMGWSAAFDYQSPAEIFHEFATLSGVAGRLGRDFDISGLAGLDDAGYAALDPVRWTVSAARSGGRFFADGAFYHADGKARLIPVRWRPPAAQPSPQFPFRLNTGRVRDQWHTMTRWWRPRPTRSRASPKARPPSPTSAASMRSGTASPCR